MSSALSMMSRKRYHEIAESLATFIEDSEKLEQALSSIREIMKFDPEKKIYTKEMGQNTAAWRKKKAQELGVSTYELSGRKNHYEQSKMQTISCS